MYFPNYVGKVTNHYVLQQVLANVSDTNSTLLSSFVDKRAIKLWQDCCFAATECCEKMISAKNNKLHQVDTTVSKDGSNLCKSAQGKPENIKFIRNFD